MSAQKARSGAKAPCRQAGTSGLEYIIGQALPFVQKQFHPSTITSSWIVASVLVGPVIGAGVSGYLADRVSRKWTKFCSGS